MQSSNNSFKLSNPYSEQGVDIISEELKVTPGVSTVVNKQQPSFIGKCVLTVVE